MTVNEAFTILVAELAEEGVPAPLCQRLTVAAVWSDLCRIAGECPPRAVAVVADLPVIPIRPVAPTPRPTPPDAA
jgi:hypothetical protein